jgi:hypothetical protein
MSIAQNFPTISPSLLLDFANVQALDPRITYTRATTATYYGTRTALAEQNLLTFSQEFDNGVWAKFNATVTANSTAAPDGTTTADTFTGGAGTTVKYIVTNYNPSIGGNGTFSFHCKAGTSSFIQLAEFASTARFANFNLTTGAVGTFGGQTTASIVSLGNGWYRCIVSFSDFSSSTQYSLLLVDSESAAYTATTTTTGTVFLWGAQLEQRSSVTAYTPTTTQPITNYIPVLETAASGVARFDHNPTTFESLGLLVEQQSTNLVTYSEQFDNAAWDKSSVTVAANQAVAPDGTLTADALVENTGSVLPAIYVGTGISLTSGTAYTGSVYLKANGRNFVAVYFQTANFPDSGRIAWFDLSTQATQFESGVTGTITSVGNNWYRCTITATADATGSTSPNALAVLITTALGVTSSYTGNGYSGIYIWGAQLEATTFPTSYIPTVASQVTRAADSASMTGTNFSSWYNQAQGTLYADGIVQTSGEYLYILSGSSPADTHELYKASTTLGGYTKINASFVSSLPVTATSNVNNKIAYAYKTNDFACSVNNSTVITDTSGVLPTVDAMNIGRSILLDYANGTIKKIAYYPIRLTDTNLQALTS